MSAYHNLLSKLSAHGSMLTMQRGGKSAIAHCPAHEDNKQSLSIKLKDDGELLRGVLIHCFAGCAAEDIVAALGMTMADLFDDPVPTKQPATELKIVATYDYRDEKGELLNQVVRLEPKSFRQRRPDGKGGWNWTLGDVRRVLYRLPEMNRDRKQPLWIVEGEKDADALAALGFRVTTTLGGASAWRPEYVDSIRRSKVDGVYVIPDNDAPGKKYAHAIASCLHAAGIPVKIVELPGVPDKGDVSDFLALSQHPAGDLRRLAQGAPMFSGSEAPPVDPTMASPKRRGWRKGTDLDDTPITYLVQDMIPKGMLGSISGKDKRGKSLLGLEIAKAVLLGEPLLGTFKVNDGVPGKVFMLLMDDPEFLVHDRLKRLGILDHPNLFIKTRNDVDEIIKEGRVVEFLQDLSQEMIEEKPAFVLIDALYILIPDGKGRSGDPQNSGGVMKPIMQALDEVCNAAHGTTVGVVIHTNKSGTDLSGSQTIRNMLKWILILDIPRKYEKDVQGGRITPDRILQLDGLKTGASAQWGMRIVGTPDGGAVWEPVEVAELERSDKKQDKIERHMKSVEWLEDFLSAGPQRAIDVEVAGWGDGFKYKPKEIARAAEALGVEKSKGGPHDQWVWKLKAS